MAVPTQKHTKSRRNKSRMHIFLRTPSLVKCQKCARLTSSHQVCRCCGYYKGREVIDVLKKMTKKERKEKEKEMKMREKEEREVKKEKPLSWEELSRR